MASKGEILHTTRVLDSNSDVKSSAKKDIQRFDRTTYEKYTKDAAGCDVDLPSMMLLRPTAPEPNAAEFCANSGDLK